MQQCIGKLTSRWCARPNSTCISEIETHRFVALIESMKLIYLIILEPHKNSQFTNRCEIKQKKDEQRCV